jgi:hypothetical protein
VQIIDRRRALHLTQQQVAAASGLHQAHVDRPTSLSCAFHASRTPIPLKPNISERSDAFALWSRGPAVSHRKCEPGVRLTPVLGRVRSPLCRLTSAARPRRVDARY